MLEVVVAHARACCYDLLGCKHTGPTISKILDCRLVPGDLDLQRLVVLAAAPWIHPDTKRLLVTCIGHDTVAVDYTIRSNWIAVEMFLLDCSDTFRCLANLKDSC